MTRDKRIGCAATHFNEERNNEEKKKKNCCGKDDSTDNGKICLPSITISIVILIIIIIIWIDFLIHRRRSIFL